MPDFSQFRKGVSSSARNAAGRTFTGNHGDGILSEEGTQNNWTTDRILTLKGGSYGMGITMNNVSGIHGILGQFEKFDADPKMGWRGIRTSPSE